MKKAFTEGWQRAAATDLLPDWGAAQGAIVKKLLAKPGGVAEVLRRTVNMFASEWACKDGVPTLKLLLSQWDSFVTNGAAVAAKKHPDPYRSQP